MQLLTIFVKHGIVAHGEAIETTAIIVFTVLDWA